MLGKFKAALVVFLAASIPATSLLSAQYLPQPQGFTPKEKASFYVNTDVGIDLFNSGAESSITGPLTALPGFSATLTGRVINSSTETSLGFGYIAPLNRWFDLGVRVFGYYANNLGSYASLRDIPQAASTSNIGNETSVKLRNFEYGIDLTPTANIGDNQFLTGIFGLGFNRARINTFGIILNNTQGAGVVENVMKRHVVGTRLGFSLEELLSRYFGIYMSYIWEGYASIHSLDSVDQKPLRLFTGDSGVDFQTHHILLGLRYYFSPRNFKTLHNATHYHFNRLYLSVAVGSLIPQYTSSSTMRVFNAPIVTLFNERIHQGSPTVMGIFAMGYGFMMHHFYLGGEAIFNAADRGSHAQYAFRERDGGFSTDDVRDVNIKLNTLEGAFDLKVGGIIAPQTMLVGRAGIAINELTLQTLEVFRVSSPVIDTPLNRETAHTVVGARFGLGLEKLFSADFGLTINYIFTYYGHIHVAGAAGVTSANVEASTTARVETHAATIGMRYYFS